jgi:hypothetical protein
MVIEDSAKAEGFTSQTVNEHLLLGSGTLSPVYAIDILEEVVDILDTILTSIPLCHRVVVCCPLTSSHILIGLVTL